MYNYNYNLPIVKEFTYQQIITDASDYFQKWIDQTLDGVSFNLRNFPSKISSVYLNIKFSEAAIDLSGLIAELNNLLITLNQYLILIKTRNQRGTTYTTLDYFGAYRGTMNDVIAAQEDIYVERSFDFLDYTNLEPESNEFWATELFFDTSRDNAMYGIQVRMTEPAHKFNTLLIKSFPTCQFYYQSSGGEYILVEDGVYNVDLSGVLNLRVEAPVIINEKNLEYVNTTDYSNILKDVYSHLPSLPIDFDIRKLPDEEEALKLFNDTYYNDYKFRAILGAYSLRLEERHYFGTKEIALESKDNDYVDNKQVSHITLETNEIIPADCAITYYVQLDDRKFPIVPTTSVSGYYIIEKPYQYLGTSGILDFGSEIAGLTDHSAELYLNGEQVTNFSGVYSISIVDYGINYNDIMWIKYFPKDNSFVVSEHLTDLEKTTMMQSEEDNVKLAHYPYVNIETGAGINVLNELNILYTNNTAYTNYTLGNNFLINPNTYGFIHKNKQVLIFDSPGVKHTVSYKYYFDKVSIVALLSNGKKTGGGTTPVLKDFTINYKYGHYTL